MQTHTLSEFLEVVNLLTKRHSLSPAYLSEDEYPAVVLDDLLESNAPYLFEECLDVEAKLLLECFLASTPPCEWELDCQLARLAATRGQLVLADAMAVIDREDWSGINPRQLLLAFLATFPDFKVRLPKMLENSLPDFRDGLFLACWHLNDSVVNRRLREKFEEWSADPSWSGTATGEDAWLKRFCAK